MPSDLNEVLASLQDEADDLNEVDLMSVAEGKPKRKPQKGRILAEVDPRDKEVWTFNFEYTDTRKKKWAGRFTNKIMNIGDLQKAARVQAAMLAGQPLHSFSGGMLEMINATSHMTLSLTERPEWATDLRAIEDPELFFAIWRKVVSHETYYFRLDADSNKEASGSGEA